MKTLAILVGGGPAPGINAVIAAATIEARNHGLRVLACYDGFRWLMARDTTHVVELQIDDVSRIHLEGGSILRTSRSQSHPDGGGGVRAEALQALGVNHLIAIGGDDTAFAASGGQMPCPAHGGPRAQDDRQRPAPYPATSSPSGSPPRAIGQGPRAATLMQDAATTEKWFFITVMGRHAGHLALGIGGAAGATLTVVAEEFPKASLDVQDLVDVLEGAIIKRRMQGREQGVAILSEGLAEKLDPATLGPVERDAYGNVRPPSWSWAACSGTGDGKPQSAGSESSSWPRTWATSCAAPRAPTTSSPRAALVTGRRTSSSTVAAMPW